MIRLQNILAFLGKSILIYVVLVLLGVFLNFRQGFVELVLKRGNSRPIVHNITRVEYRKYNKGIYDLKLIVKYRTLGMESPVSCWYYGYLPFSLMLSLMFATKYPNWKKLVLALISGVILFYLFFAFFLNQMVVGFEVYAKQELNEPVGFFKNKIVAMINALISNHYWLFMVVPIVIWIMVSFKSIALRRTIV